MKRRCIYEIADHERKIVYVGLTNNFKRRMKEHRIFARNRKPKQLTDYVDEEDAQKLETSFVWHYQLLGYTVLNKAKPGSLGGQITVHDILTVHRHALKCSTRKEFEKQFNAYYQAAVRHGWIGFVTLHMQRKKFRHSVESCRKIAIRHETRKSYERENKSSYEAARRNGWLDEICKHMRAK